MVTTSQAAWIGSGAAVGVSVVVVLVLMILDARKKQPIAEPVEPKVPPNKVKPTPTQESTSTPASNHNENAVERVAVVIGKGTSNSNSSLGSQSTTRPNLTVDDIDHPDVLQDTPLALVIAIDSSKQGCSANNPSGDNRAAYAELVRKLLMTLSVRAGGNLTAAVVSFAGDSAELLVPNSQNLSMATAAVRGLRPTSRSDANVSSEEGARRAVDFCQKTVGAASTAMAQRTDAPPQRIVRRVVLLTGGLMRGATGPLKERVIAPIVAVASGAANRAAAVRVSSVAMYAESEAQASGPEFLQLLVRILLLGSRKMNGVPRGMYVKRRS